MIRPGSLQLADANTLITAAIGRKWTLLAFTIVFAVGAVSVSNRSLAHAR